MEEHGKLAWGAAWGCISAVFASLGPALGVLIFMQVMDFLTAVIANGKAGKLNPEQGYYGWRRKANTIIVVLCIAVLQLWGPENVQAIPAAQGVCGGFAAIEFISVVRNLLLTGATLPAFVREPFAKLVDLVEGSHNEDSLRTQ